MPKRQYIDVRGRITPDLLSKLIKENHGRSRVAPAIRCKDGYVVSVQASKRHACSPKDDDGPWSNFETLIFRDKGNTLATSDIGCWIPAQRICDILNKHNGVG